MLTLASSREFNLFFTDSFEWGKTKKIKCLFHSSASDDRKSGWFETFEAYLVDLNIA